VPISFSYRQPYSKWTFAMGMYMPESWGYCHASGDPARFQGKSFYLQHLVYASPSISYQLTDRMALGVSIALGQSAMGLKTDLRFVNEKMANVLTTVRQRINQYNWKTSINTFEPIADLELSLRDDFSPSFNVGFLIEPMDHLTIAMSYNSPIYRRLKGDFQIEYTDGFKWVIKQIGVIGSNDPFYNKIETLNPSGETGKVILNHFYKPQQINFGIMLKLSTRLRFLADLHWQNWSSLDDQIYEFSDSVDLFSLYNFDTGHPDNQLSYQKCFDDVINWSIGIEYQLKESLNLRLGYERRPNSVRKEYFDLFSYPDTNLIAAGFGIKQKNRVTIDFGMGYIFSTSYDVPSNVSQNLNSSKHPLTNPYYGQNYQTSVKAYLLSLNIAIPFEVVKKNIKKLYY